MDKTQLITIAISALAGAVAKSLVAWIVSIIKTTKIVKTVTAKIKILFSITNRAVIIDILSLAFYVIVLVNFAFDKAPPTKLDVLIAIGSVLACIFMGIALIIDVAKAIVASKTADDK